MEEPTVTEKVRKLESIFRQLVASAMAEEPKQLSEEDLGLLDEVGTYRALWLEVQGLEDAEEGYRQQAAEAARRHGVATARLIMAGIEDGHPSTFILTVPALTKHVEGQIADGLQTAVQTMLGGVLMEHEMLKSTMATTIMSAGRTLPNMDKRDREVLCEAMRKLDFETIADALGLQPAPVDDNPEAPTA